MIVKYPDKAPSPLVTAHIIPLPNDNLLYTQSVKSPNLWLIRIVIVSATHSVPLKSVSVLSVDHDHLLGSCH